MCTDLLLCERAAAGSPFESFWKLVAEGGQHPGVVGELGAVTVHEVTGGEEGLLTDCMPGLTRAEVISVLRTVAEADPEEARELFAAAGLSLTFCPESPS